MKLDWIGWLATALFASSYLFKQPGALRKVQAGAALLWVIYGLMIHALPVVVANLVVAAVAVGSGLVGQVVNPVVNLRPMANRPAGPAPQ
ncbi:MAG: hypothetical protein LAQ69_11815 [Acidobacteriia bacterium]|nr:hypothetical protein [Terriglobia bacterium]